MDRLLVIAKVVNFSIVALHIERKYDKIIIIFFTIELNRKYKDYVYRKMLVQEYLKQ